MLKGLRRILGRIGRAGKTPLILECIAKLSNAEEDPQRHC
jgi:hypothetical protein